MIKPLTNHQWGIISAACVMGLATCMPIARIPIVGSVFYLARGRGDGVIVLLLAAAIVALAIFQYRKTAACVGFIAAGVMVTTLARLGEAFSKFHVEASQLAKNNPFGNIALLASQNAGLDFGWLFLLGGACAVIVLSLLPANSLGGKTAN